MSAAANWHAGPVVSVEAMLGARERRVGRRNAVLARYPGRAVVTVSVVMPGPVKDCGLSRLAFSVGLAALDHLLVTRGWSAIEGPIEIDATGPEALVSVEVEPEVLKRALSELEETHPLGRFWDLDVSAPDGRAVSRRALGLDPRRCLICNAPAHACARSRAHSLEDLLAVMEDRIDAWLVHPSAPAF